MDLVAARGLVKTFGEDRAARRVLDGADLDVARGEIVAVVGRSGSGKSTLLHLLGGLDRAEAGTIEVDGVRLDREPEPGRVRYRRERVGFVFQFFHLIPELTGRENVLLPTRAGAGLLGRRPRHAAGGETVAGELIDRLGLSDVADRLPHTLSGGEQQRLALARALVNDPALVLADEPTGNLDPGAGREVLALLREVAADGRGIVLVTHDTVAADEVADRVLHLEHGRLRA